MFLVKVKMKPRQRKVGGDVKAVMGERERERRQQGRLVKRLNHRKKHEAKIQQIKSTDE